MSNLVADTGGGPPDEDLGGPLTCDDDGAPSGTRTPNPLRTGGRCGGSWLRPDSVTCTNAVVRILLATPGFAHFRGEGRGVNRGVLALSQDPLRAVAGLCIETYACLNTGSESAVGANTGRARARTARQRRPQGWAAPAAAGALTERRRFSPNRLADHTPDGSDVAPRTHEPPTPVAPGAVECGSISGDAASGCWSRAPGLHYLRGAGRGSRAGCGWPE